MGAAPSMDDEIKDVMELSAEFCGRFAGHYAKTYTLGLVRKQKLLSQKEVNGTKWNLTKCPEKNPVPAIRKAGSILKRSDHLKKWNTRYFVVRGNWTVEYFEKEEDFVANPDKPRGIINMGLLRVNKDVKASLLERLEAVAEKAGIKPDELPGPEQHPEFTFELYHARADPMYMQASDKEDFDAWVKVLKDAHYHAPTYHHPDDKVHTRAFPVALSRTRHDVGLSGYFHKSAGEVHMLSESICEDMDRKIMPRVDDKLANPEAHRNPNHAKAAKAAKIGGAVLKRVGGVAAGAVGVPVPHVGVPSVPGKLPGKMPHGPKVPQHPHKPGGASKSDGIPWPARMKMRASFMKSVRSMARTAVAPAWTKAYETAHEKAPLAEEKIKEKLGPITEAEKGLKEKITAKVESDANASVTEKITPHIGELLAGAAGPIVAAMELLPSAFEELLSDGREHYEPQEKRFFYVCRYAHSKAERTAERPLAELGAPLRSMHKVFHHLSIGTVLAKCRKRMHRVLLNALYTFEVKLEELKESDCATAWEDAASYTMGLLTQDCPLAINKCLGYVVTAAVEHSWEHHVVSPARKAIEPIRETVPDAVKEFVDPDEVLEDVLHTILKTTVEEATTVAMRGPIQAS